jgi:hypothetical protein
MEITRDYDKHRTYIKNIPSAEHVIYLAKSLKTIWKFKDNLIILNGIFNQDEILNHLNFFDNIKTEKSIKKDILSEEYIAKFKDFEKNKDARIIITLHLKFNDIELKFNIRFMRYVYKIINESYSKVNFLKSSINVAYYIDYSFNELYKIYNNYFFDYFCKLFNYCGDEDIFDFKKDKIGYNTLIQNILIKLKSEYYDGLANDISPEKLKEIEDDCSNFEIKINKFLKYIGIFMFFSEISTNLDKQIRHLSPERQAFIKSVVAQKIPAIWNMVIKKMQKLNKDVPHYRIISEKPEPEPESDPEPENSG